MLLIVLLLTICYIANAKVYDFSQLPKFDISDYEILSFVDELRLFDENKARISQIKLDFQGHTFSDNPKDEANKNFFYYVNESLFDKPTYRNLISLYDNYIFETGYEEEDTFVV